MKRTVRKPIIAGNWKMYTTVIEASALTRALVAQVKTDDVDVVLCPPFVNLLPVFDLIKNTLIKLGAQNMFYEPIGAFTGEISAVMLQAVGCEYVIIGHSERRQIMGESLDAIRRKVGAALDQGLIPILCVGETLAERESGVTRDVVTRQLQSALTGIISKQINSGSGLVVAYEPVWAIGTGRVATPDQAQEVHQHIRQLLCDQFDVSAAENVRLLYGGSVKPDNFAELILKPDIDGALVGGASLKAETFFSLIQQCGSKL